MNAVGVIDEGRMKKEASELFQKIGNDRQPRPSPCAICPYHSGRCARLPRPSPTIPRVIVLDEPTSSLTVQEVEQALRDDEDAERSRELP